jgi:hypothetical protein
VEIAKLLVDNGAAIHEGCEICDGFKMNH